MDYDVIVIGGGLAGHCAALEAAEAGAKVLVLEKRPEVGGSTVLSGGSFAFAGTDEQRAQGINDTSELLASDMREVGAYKNDPSLVQVYADGQLEAYRWLKERGVGFGPIQAASGQSVPRQHPADPRDVIRRLNALVDAAPGITVRMGSAAHRLLRDGANGLVIGVSLAPDGGEVIEARRGVILTAGGFSRNPDMLDQFAPNQAGAKHVGGPGNTGDGIRMALALGADLRDTPFIKGTFGNHPDAGPEEHTAMLAIYRGAIAINRSGERYANESVSYKLLGDACLQQEGKTAFQLFDQGIFDDQVEAVPIFNFSRRLEQGYLKKAGSLEALAALIGVPAGPLRQTVEAYNAGIVAGTDCFGRRGLVQDYGTLKPIATPPFYAYPSTSAIIATYAGVAVTPEMAVRDVFGAPIEGLFAAGEMTGGFHGAAFMTGTSLGKCVICGRIAGRNAAGRR